MRILSHRGYWKTAEEKNTRAAFIRSFDLGFGTETDIRDVWGELYISHDPPTQNAHPITFDALCEIYIAHGGRDQCLPLALNIKADGLTTRIKETTNRYGITEYFVFDMSVPDTRHYLAQGEPVYTRHSQYEPVPAFYKESQGIWIDDFVGDWLTIDSIRTHRNADKSVCIVSPDLHKRPHELLWRALKKAGFSLSDGDDYVSICTDFPEDARHFFKFEQENS